MNIFFHSRARWLFLLILVSSFFYISPVYAREVIHEFKSHISVNLDSSADITETIGVGTEEQAIRHGIVRLFLQQYTDRQGLNHWTRYHIYTIEKNGLRSPYMLQHSLTALQIYVGDKNVLLAPGEYVYTLKYHVEQVVSHLNDTDEFYWNITGNNWAFPIEHADVDFILPPGIDITNYFAFTGAFGERGRDYSAGIVSDNEVHFETTRELNPQEGLTIGVAWPTGFMKQRSYLQNFLQGGDLIALEVFIFLIFYYIAVFYWESREPVAGSIIPLFAPPPTISPAAMRYIYNMKFDDKTFTAAIISMATKGYISIEQNGSKFTLKRISTNASDLSYGEVGIVKELFADDDIIELTPRNQRAIQRAKGALGTSLKKECDSTYFLTHAIYVLPAALLSALGLVAICQQALSDVYEIIFIMTWAIFIWVYCVRFYSTILDVIRMFHYPSWTLFKEIFMSTISLIFILLITILFSTYLFSFTVAEIILFLSILAINIIFYHLLRAHTPEGRKLMDQIEGFKMYLATTEKDRFNTLNPPERTPQLFEKYFPYALALDVENEWSMNFSSILTATSQSGQQTTFRPAWFIGSGWDAANPAAFAGSLSNGFTSSVGISSSGGGGGFSGGGGGGGGGGGW